MYTLSAIEKASQELEQFLHLQAHKISKQIGISYCGVTDCEAPQTLETIRDTFSDCIKHVKPFPVSRDNCETAIYSVAGNMAFRFWHDWLHLKHNAETNLQDELILGEQHTAAVMGRFGDKSLHAKLMWLDTCGQSLYCHNIGDFPRYQKRFVHYFLINNSVTAPSLTTIGRIQHVFNERFA